MAKEAVIISAQVDRETADKLNQLACEHDRTLSAEVRRAVRAHVERHQERKPEAPEAA